MSQKKSKCWQCGKEFARKTDEIRCTTCAKDPQSLKRTVSFKGRGFYSTGG